MTDDQVRMIADAITSISHRTGGPTPTGLEALAMSLCGEGAPGHKPLASSVEIAGHDIYTGLSLVADAINRIADAMEEQP